MAKKKSASDIVKDYIFKQLENKQLSIGNRLPTESQLSETLGIGRSSVREALQSLKSIGLIQSNQGSGYTVICDTEKSFSDSLRAMMAVKNIKLTDISEIREALEIKAAELAIKRGITSNDIDFLKKSITDMESDSKASPKQTTEHDINFHRKIAELSGNNFLTSFIFALSSFSSRYILISWDTVSDMEIKKLLNTHRKIIYFLEGEKISEVKNEIINHYHNADEIISRHIDDSNNPKNSAEYLLEKLYADGFTTDEICAKLYGKLPE